MVDTFASLQIELDELFVRTQKLCNKGDFCVELEFNIPYECLDDGSEIPHFNQSRVAFFAPKKVDRFSKEEVLKSLTAGTFYDDYIPDERAPALVVLKEKTNNDDWSSSGCGDWDSSAADC